MVNTPDCMRVLCRMKQTYRFEEDLSRVTEYEGEAEDDGGEGNKGCQRVCTIEDEQAKEDDDDKRSTEQDCV